MELIERIRSYYNELELKEVNSKTEDTVDNDAVDSLKNCDEVTGASENVVVESENIDTGIKSSPEKSNEDENSNEKTLSNTSSPKGSM